MGEICKRLNDKISANIGVVAKPEGDMKVFPFVVFVKSLVAFVL